MYGCVATPHVPFGAIATAVMSEVKSESACANEPLRELSPVNAANTKTTAYRAHTEAIKGPVIAEKTVG